MASRGQVAKQVRQSKERDPQLYCPNVRCLWRCVNSNTGVVSPCPTHQGGKK